MVDAAPGRAVEYNMRAAREVSSVVGAPWNVFALYVLGREVWDRVEPAIKREGFAPSP